MIPRATYRIQFHKGFTFADAAGIADYLARLGISHVYASPIQTARPGSLHCYDIVDHASVNPELGGSDGFAKMAQTLKERGIGIILDIVPNHMFVGSDNRWWNDVLRNGEHSAFAQHFDIDWRPDDPELQGKILLPFLGEPYDQALTGDALRIVYDGAPMVAYHDHRFPLRREDCALLSGNSQPMSQSQLQRYSRPVELNALLSRQHYLLAWWRSAGDRINWRRFFDITELCALKCERPEVFDAVHALPLSLYREGLVDGFRVDHVDGLSDPATYSRRLREKLTELAPARNEAFLVVEKILASGEAVCSDWPIQGTTGYDFLGQSSALLHQSRGQEPLVDLWRRRSQRSADFEQEEKTARREILSAFRSRLESTVSAFTAAASTLELPELNVASLRSALQLLLENLRVYRTYASGTSGRIAQRYFTEALAKSSRDAATEVRAALHFIGSLVEGRPEVAPEASADALRRFEQLSTTLAAKSVEDTAFYRHVVLLSRNDVGADPRIFSLTPDAFHADTAHRSAHWPHAMLTTATHDHKRGEDARARLAVLSEIAEEWQEETDHWYALTARLRDSGVEDSEVYHLFQTLVGAWPFGLRPDDPANLKTFSTRILTWRIKSLREAKLKTSWQDINRGYEAGHTNFTAAILDPEQAADFLSRLASFVNRIGPAGSANGLVQLVLRLTSPGVPDTFQGREFWDFSLVDPDNRSAVDYLSRLRALGSGSCRDLLQSWRDGRIKQAMQAAILHHRKSTPHLYDRGDYLPLRLQGPRSENILAFARRWNAGTMVVAVLRCCSDGLVGGNALVPLPDWWRGTRMIFKSSENALRDILTGAEIPASNTIDAKDLFAALPAAVLVTEQGRKA